MNIERNGTLLLGGTGKTGRRVAERLAARGRLVRVGSRAGAPPFEWADRGTWAPVLAGVESIYLAYYPDLAAPEAAERVGALSRLAVASGVRRIVLLSGRGEPQVEASERAVRESGAAYTVLRCAWFNQNFSEGALLEPLRGGELAFPAGAVSEPFLDAEDVADVAVAALTDDAHAGQTYELTGPRLLGFGEAVDAIARATGRDLRYLPVSAEEYAAGLAPYLPAEEAGFLAGLFAYLLDGHNAHLADGVERVLGRRPRDFDQYVREAAAAGAWAA